MKHSSTQIGTVVDSARHSSMHYWFITRSGCCFYRQVPRVFSNLETKLSMLFLIRTSPTTSLAAPYFFYIRFIKYSTNYDSSIFSCLVQITLSFSMHLCLRRTLTIICSARSFSAPQLSRISQSYQAWTSSSAIHNILEQLVFVVSHYITEILCFPSFNRYIDDLRHS